MGNKGGGSNSVTYWLRKIVAENEGIKAKQLAEAIIINAAKGNGVAMKIVVDRIDGILKESLEFDGTITIRYADGNDNRVTEVSPGAGNNLDEPEAL